METEEQASPGFKRSTDSINNKLIFEYCAVSHDSLRYRENRAITIDDETERMLE